MKSIVLVAGLALASLPPALDATPGPAGRSALPEAATLWFRADITVTADGKATDLEWRNYTDMPEAALGFLERRIDGWTFRPGMVAGVPVATGTSLVIQVVAIERPDGRFGLEIASVVPGPSLVGPLVRNRSPYWDVLARGPSKSGHAVLDVRYEPGRDAEIDIVEFETSSGNRRYVSALEDDSRWEVDQWRVRHETLDGKPIPARFLWANRYCYFTPWCDENEAARASGLPEMPARQPAPLESAVELLSDVVTVDVLPDGLPDEPGPGHAHGPDGT